MALTNVKHYYLRVPSCRAPAGRDGPLQAALAAAPWYGVYLRAHQFVKKGKEITDHANPEGDGPQHNLHGTACRGPTGLHSPGNASHTSFPSMTGRDKALQVTKPATLCPSRDMERWCRVWYAAGRVEPEIDSLVSVTHHRVSE